MVLCIDVGNSRIKIAEVDARGVRRIADVPTKRFVERPSRLGRLIAPATAGPVDLMGAAFSSVVPSLNKAIINTIREKLGVGALKIDARSRLPFRVEVKNPSKVGSDRLAAAAGLNQRTSNAIIVDIGSAITVDLVSDGVFAGGLIMPGPVLGLRALGAYARKLPKIDYAKVPRHFPTRFNDTRPSMILGANIGALGAVREAVWFLSQKTSGRPRVAVTGGGAQVFAGRLPASWRSDPDLVLRGIHRVWVLSRG